VFRLPRGLFDPDSSLIDQKLLLMVPF